MVSTQQAYPAGGFIEKQIRTKGCIDNMTTKQLVTLVSLLSGILLAAGILISLTLNGPFIHDELVALDLIPKPEKLTELYFNANTDLPHSDTNNQVVSFAFIIHNLETADYQYTYKVSVNSNGIRHIVDTGNVEVKNNQYYVKDENFKLKDSSGHDEIIVELVNKQQSIHFWIGA